MTTSAGGFLPYPGALARRLLASPALLYRMGAGRALDLMHIMVLTTRGRRSGQPRYTPVEYRRHGNKYYVISAWGDRPDWYRNLIEHSQVTIRRGGRVFGARASRVESTSEALMVLHLFRRPNPLVYDAILARLANSQTLDPRTLPEVSGQYTIVRFDPQPGELTLPSVPLDLRPWVAAAAVVLLLLLVMSLVRSRRTPTTEVA